MEWSIAIATLGTIVPLIIAWRAQKTAKQRQLENSKLQAEVDKTKAEAMQAMADAEQSKAEAMKLQADAMNAAASSVSLLLDPLNVKIRGLEGGMEALNTEAKTLRQEREEREKRHQEELTTMRAVQTAMQLDLDEMRLGVGILAIQLKEAGIEPRWMPKVKPKTGPLTS